MRKTLPNVMEKWRRSGAKLQKEGLVFKSCRQRIRLEEEDLDEEIRTCKQEKTDEAVVHLNPKDAASIWPWWSSSSRWVRHMQGSRSKFYKKSSIKV